MLNQNYSESVCIDTTTMEWEASPAAGVWRKKLEREGEESGRATSLVRYDPGSSFTPHVHTGGEEIFVLDGVFSDEKGDYPAGSYFRNPPGTSHTPSSKPGCTLFVKLCYFQPGDKRQIVVDRSHWHWNQGKVPAEKTFLLHQFHQENTMMVQLDGDTPWRCTHAAQGREILIVEGSLIVNEATIASPGWLRFSPDDHTVVTSGSQGATLLYKTGHYLHLEKRNAVV